MRFSSFVPFAAAATALVIPDQDVMSKIAIETHQAAEPAIEKLESKIPCHETVKSVGEQLMSWFEASKNTLDDAIEWGSEHMQEITEQLQDENFDAEEWLSSTTHASVDEDEWPEDRPPHHKPGHGRPRRPRHPHHRKPNQTVYELITKSKYTTKLAALINEDSDLVDLLNGTTANFTIFAPTDKAFEKIPDHAKKPSKEIIKKVLSYHVSGEFYPAGRVLVTRTVPTLLEGEYLSEDPKSTPQRLSTNIGLRGLTVNYYSRIVAIDIFGTNGVIHGVDSLLIPPPQAAQIISFLPSEFSTLELGLVKTGLYDVVNDTSNHLGGTLFAPSNFAFQKLGPRINAFLFSKYGQKYLAALLKYHVVSNSTLYSDAFYTASKPDSEAKSVPKGRFHVDLPTLLEDRYLSIDIGRYGRLIDVRINSFVSVARPDGISKDGVIHVVNSVLIPPKRLDGELQMWEGEDLTVGDLMDRLEPLVEDEDNEAHKGRFDL